MPSLKPSSHYMTLKRQQIAVLFRLHDLIVCLEVVMVFTLRDTATGTDYTVTQRLYLVPKPHFFHKNSREKWNRNDAKQHVKQELFI